MATPSKQNTLYLPIKQVYFDQIIAGTKKEEYREIGPNTYKKYLDCDEEGFPYIESDYYSPEDMEFYEEDMLIACKDGKFPFFFREDIKFLNLVVGYNKVRDTATVEVTSITPRIAPNTKGQEVRFDFTPDNQIVLNPNGQFCQWQAVFHLGKIIEKIIVSK